MLLEGSASTIKLIAHKFKYILRCLYCLIILGKYMHIMKTYFIRSDKYCMKDWFRYQLENQVEDFNWDGWDSPIGNLFDYAPELKQLFAEIKHGYDAGMREPEFRQYPTKKFTDQVYQNIVDESISYSQVEQMVADPNPVTKVNVVYLSNEEHDQIQRALALHMAANFSIDLNNIKIYVHLQTPGQMFQWHLDRPKNRDTRTDAATYEPNYSRYIMFVHDQQPGQFFQMGNTNISWRAGDIFTWNARDIPHASANAGFDDRWAVLINGLIY